MVWVLREQNPGGVCSPAGRQVTHLLFDWQGPSVVLVPRWEWASHRTGESFTSYGWHGHSVIISS